MLIILGMILIIISFLLLVQTIYFLINSKIARAKIIDFVAGSIYYGARKKAYPIIKIIDSNSLIQEEHFKINIVDNRNYNLGDIIEVRYCNNVRFNKVRINNIFGIWGGVILCFSIGVAFIVFGFLLYLDI